MHTVIVQQPCKPATYFCCLLGMYFLVDLVLLHNVAEHNVNVTKTCMLHNLGAHNVVVRNVKMSKKNINVT
jgi:hypothetical protein